jgi:hypothetical protein
MKLQLGYRSLQTEKQAAVGTAGIINTVPIGDEAAAQPTYIQEGIPIGAIPGETRHVDGEDQPDFAESDQADKLLEAASLRGGRAAQAKIGIDYIDISLMPSELDRIPEAVIADLRSIR